MINPLILGKLGRHFLLNYASVCLYFQSTVQGSNEFDEEAQDKHELNI
jgi:hypothetical protein